MKTPLLDDDISSDPALSASPHHEPLSPSLTPRVQPPSLAYSMEWHSMRAHPNFYVSLDNGLKNRASALNALFNLLGSTLGGAALALPFAAAKVGVPSAIVMSILSCLVTQTSLYILISCSRRTGAQTYQHVAFISLGSLGCISATALLFFLTLFTLICHFILIRDFATSLLTTSTSSTPHTEAANVSLNHNIALVLLVFCSIPATSGLSTLPPSLLRYTSALALFCVVVLILFLSIHPQIVHPTATTNNNSSNNSYLSNLVSTFPLFLASCSLQHLALPYHGDLILPSRIGIKRFSRALMLLVFILHTLLFLSVHYNYPNPSIGLIFSLPDTYVVRFLRLLFILLLLFLIPTLLVPCRDNAHLLFTRCFSFIRRPVMTMQIQTRVSAPFRVRLFETLLIYCVCLVIATTHEMKHLEFIWQMVGLWCGVPVCFVLPALMYLSVRRVNYHNSMTLPSMMLVVFAFGVLLCGAVNLIVMAV
eukprot:c3362_g1_i1.p1 GENE.c3362_g1_i1~~c3362_g1_i1.p1  ORF type:complete len:479 (-),score=78.12 c3362_g1_i1:69-1505(-)